VTSIPQQWDASWFRGFISNYLQPADIRNTTSGTGIQITPSPNGVASPGTVSLNAQYASLVNEPYVVAATPSDATLNDWRLIAGESGVITVSDGGAKQALTVGIQTNGISNSLIRESAATSVVGNATGSEANVADITSSADGQVLQQAGGVLVFAALPATALAPIPNDTVLGNVSGGAASPSALTQAQLTALINAATVSLSGAMPALSGVATEFLNGVGGWSAPPASPTGANPSATIGLTVTNGTAATFMRSDAAPALNQGITPTWTGVHTFQPAGGISAVAANMIGNLALTGQGNGQIQITPVGAGSVLQAAFQYFQDNNLYIDAPTTGTPVGYQMFLRTAGTIAMTISAAQNVTFAKAVRVNGVSPPARVTGWGTPAGPATVANFPASPTLAQCGQAVGQIINALKNFGLFGA